MQELVGTCLRAERIAKRWAHHDIHSRRQPVKISFPDNRIVTYFTFLPGTRHLMVFDVQNILSCWTTDGRQLQSWRVAKGGKLTRWKPCDESESSYDIKDHAQGVELMIELPRQVNTVFCMDM